MESAKICRKCKLAKNVSDYYVRSGTNRPFNICKECAKEERRVIDSKNVKRVREYYIKNKDKQKHRQKEFRKNNPDKAKELTKKYYNRYKHKSGDYFEKNKERIRKYHREYKRKKMNESPIYKAEIYIRNRCSQMFSVKGWKKGGKTEAILGCTYEEAKRYIESKFTDGMNWGNFSYYGWQIDHIIPLSSATSIDELISLCHYTNLQPLWREDNQSKGDKILKVV